MLKVIQFYAFLTLVSTVLLSSSYASQYTIDYDSSQQQLRVSQLDGGGDVFVAGGSEEVIDGLGTLNFKDNTIQLEGDGNIVDAPSLSVTGAQNLNLTLNQIHLAGFSAESIADLHTTGKVVIDEAQEIRVQNLVQQNGGLYLKNAHYVVQDSFQILADSAFHARENLKVSFAAIENLGEIIAKNLTVKLVEAFDLGKLTVAQNLIVNLAHGIDWKAVFPDPKKLQAEQIGLGDGLKPLNVYFEDLKKEDDSGEESDSSDVKNRDNKDELPEIKKRWYKQLVVVPIILISFVGVVIPYVYKYWFQSWSS